MTGAPSTALPVTVRVAAATLRLETILEAEDGEVIDVPAGSASGFARDEQEPEADTAAGKVGEVDSPRRVAGAYGLLAIAKSSLFFLTV